MTQRQGAHEQRNDGNRTTEDRGGAPGTKVTQNTQSPEDPRSSHWKIRDVVTIAIVLAGLASLGVVSYSSITTNDEIRSQSKIAYSQSMDSLYSCLENQVHHLVPEGAHVWIDQNLTVTSADKKFPRIADPLRVVVANYSTLTSVRQGHISLFMTPSTSKQSCYGLTIERGTSPDSLQPALR